MGKKRGFQLKPKQEPRLAATRSHGQMVTIQQRNNEGIKVNSTGLSLQVVLEGCSQVTETCHPFLALEAWKQQRWMEARVILPVQV